MPGALSTLPLLIDHNRATPGSVPHSRPLLQRWAQLANIECGVCVCGQFVGQGATVVWSPARANDTGAWAIQVLIEWGDQLAL